MFVETTFRDAVLAFAPDVRPMHAGPIAQFELGKVDVLHLDCSRLYVGHSPI
jgi:hypothetical protein